MPRFHQEGPGNVHVHRNARSAASPSFAVPQDCGLGGSFLWWSPRQRECLLQERMTLPAWGKVAHTQICRPVSTGVIDSIYLTGVHSIINWQLPVWTLIQRNSLHIILHQAGSVQWHLTSLTRYARLFQAVSPPFYVHDFTQKLCHGAETCCAPRFSSHPTGISLRINRHTLRSRMWCRRAATAAPGAHPAEEGGRSTPVGEDATSSSAHVRGWKPILDASISKVCE